MPEVLGALAGIDDSQKGMDTVIDSSMSLYCDSHDVKYDNRGHTVRPRATVDTTTSLSNTVLPVRVVLD